MTEAFNNLEHDKQQRIINAAMKEFADKGYERASTNTIVKHAGISKGVLFYYFDSKKGLYLYLVNYAIQTIKRDYLNLVDMTITDFIERLLHLAKIKINYYHANPDVSLFLSEVYVNPSFTLPEHLAVQLAELEKLSYKTIYDQIDTSLLRDDVDPDKAFQLINFAIEGYNNHLLALFKGKHLASIDLDPYWDEFYEYITILKTCFYK